MREVLCEYISWFQGQLCALITDKDELENGSKYIKRSNIMRKDGMWATEVEILATAKCFRSNIFTYYNDKWEHHSYLAEFSEDAIYLMKKITSNLFWDCNKLTEITTVQKVIYFNMFHTV